MIYLTENLRNNKDRFNTIIFDVDGVLVDTSSSYAQAVLDAVACYGAEINGCTWKPRLFHYERFKRLSGFNNDWDVAEALLLYFLQKEVLRDPVSFSDFIRDLGKDAQGNDSLSSWMDRSEKGEAEKLSGLYKKEKIRSFAGELYAGSTRCSTFYGKNPLLGGCPGTSETEKILIDTARLKRFDGAAGVYTGRNYAELRDVFSKIGYSGWREEYCFCDDSRSPVKPDPIPLCIIADSRECTGIIFAGDSRDDFETARNFSTIRPGFPFEFVQIMKQGSRFNCSHSALDTINQLLNFLLWEIS